MEEDAGKREGRAPEAVISEWEHREGTPGDVEDGGEDIGCCEIRDWE